MSGILFFIFASCESLRIIMMELSLFQFILFVLTYSPVSHSACHQRPARERHKIRIFIMGKCQQPSAAQYRFYTLPHFSLLLNVDNDFISKYTDINNLHVTQIDLLHYDTFCSTFKFARFRCKKGSLRVNSVMILVVLSTHAELESATARGHLYWETGELKILNFSWYQTSGIKFKVNPMKVLKRKNINNQVFHILWSYLFEVFELKQYHFFKPTMNVKEEKFSYKLM